VAKEGDFAGFAKWFFLEAKLTDDPGHRQSASTPPKLLAAVKNGRAGEIRTHDLLHPMQARYQATLRPDDQLEGRKSPMALV
jgi:hypothetical protein